MKRLFSVLLLFIVLIGQAQEPTATLKAKTDLVLVPVVVTRDGKPVTGLTKSDFELMHERQSEQIAVFEEITATVSAPPAVSNTPGVAANFGSGDTHNDTYIVLLDFLNARWENTASMRTYMRNFAEQFASTNTRVAVLMLTPKGLVQAHSFTSDPAELLKAVDAWTKQKIEPVNDPFQPSQWGSVYSVSSRTGTTDVFERLALPASYLNQLKLDQAAMTTQALEQISAAFEGVPGRKRLIWVSTGFPNVGDTDLNRPTYEFNIHDKVVRAWHALSTNNIVVYPIDSNGGPVNPAFDDRSLPNTSSMLEVAKRTGGRTCVDMLHNCMERTIAADKHYYLLGFYMRGQPKTGWHKLKVELNGQKADVRARTGFMVADDKPKTKEDDHDIVIAALASPLDYTGIPLMMRWRDSSTAEKKQIEFELASPPGGILVDSTTGNMDLNLLVFIRPVGKPDGRSYPATLVATLTPEKQKIVMEKGFRYAKQVPVTPGEYEMKIFLRDNIGKKIGTVSAPLTIK